MSGPRNDSGSIAWVAIANAEGTAKGDPCLTSPLTPLFPRCTPLQHLTQEVTLDGACVLEKSGPYKREWMNRFPWRRRKDSDYQLHVQDDGMEVRLGERTIWGVTADDMMG